MRTIKFRGKRVANGEWVYGYYLESFTGISYILTVYDHILSMIEKYEVDPETVGQYTGLSDESGTEIYEGDICRLTNTYLGMNTKSTIEIAYEDWAFVGRWPEVESPTGYMFTPLGGYNFPAVLIEVIGNIHENPGLPQEATT